MGIVKEELKLMIDRAVREKGLCVWLDPGCEYEPFVRRWIADQGDHSTLPWPVIAFDGSLLDTIMRLDEHISGIDVPKCLIYLPGFDQVIIKNTPFLEVYEAGKEFEVDLKNLVRSACSGKLAPDRIDEITAIPDLTLDDADQKATIEDKTHPGIKQLLLEHGYQTVALDIMTDQELIRSNLSLPAAPLYDAVFGFLNLQYGLTKEWIDLWPHIGDTFPGIARLKWPFAGHVFCTEYVTDLKAEAAEDRLKSLKKLSKTQQVNCQKITRHLRREAPDTYKTLSLEIEKMLTGEISAVEPDALGDTDTFSFEEEKMIQQAFAYLSDQRWGNAQKLVNRRLNPDNTAKIDASFWVHYDEEKKWTWQWVRAACSLMEQLDIAGKTMIEMTRSDKQPEDFLASYTREDGLYRVDRAHRLFEQQTARLNMIHKPKRMNEIQGLTGDIRQAYRKFADRLSELFTDSCRRHGFLPPPEYRQREFHARDVAPLSARHPVAVFYIDAFRYELGVNLMEKLMQLPGNTTIRSCLAELPTVTAVGMNVLVPHPSNGALTPILNRRTRKFDGFVFNGKSVTGPLHREKMLKHHGAETVKWMRLEEIRDTESGMLKNSIKNIRLLAIHSLDIDEKGEKGILPVAPDFYENTLNQLLVAVKRLQQAGIKQFVFVADHGFLFCDTSVHSESIPHLDVETARYAIHHAEIQYRDIVSVPFKELGYVSGDASGDDRYLILKKHTGLNIAPKSLNAVVHGGNSLQERAIPVVTYTTVKTRVSGDSGAYSVKITPEDPLWHINRILVRAEPVNLISLASQKDVNLQIDAADQPAVTVQIGEVTPGSHAGNRITIPVNTDVTIMFRLIGAASGEVPIRISQPENDDPVAPAVSDTVFPVHRPDAPASGSGERAAGIPEAEDTVHDWRDRIPEEFHAVIRHIEIHGAITEETLIRQLGGPGRGSRKARKFSAMLPEWLKYLPFQVEIGDAVDEGKEYRKR
jgi:hypothetical protein